MPINLRTLLAVGCIALAFATSLGAAEPRDCVIFSTNVQDFAHPEENVATLRRIHMVARRVSASDSANQFYTP
ncbi:MAG: hypothetical protein EXS35_00970, partial [Pedosphaera sp.]|nr:hypothetical protein [Pedosphaera sp.]